MSLLSQMKMFLGGAQQHSIETIAARVAKRGKVPAGKLVATFVDGKLKTAIRDEKHVEKDQKVIDELNEFYALSARVRADLMHYRK